MSIEDVKCSYCLGKGSNVIYHEDLFSSKNSYTPDPDGRFRHTETEPCLKCDETGYLIVKESDLQLNLNRIE